MQKRAAIYVRVSTDKQTVENQIPSCGRSPSVAAGRSSGSITTPGSAAPRVATSGLGSTRCSKTPAGAALTWLCLGRSIGWGGR